MKDSNVLIAEFMGRKVVSLDDIRNNKNPMISSADGYTIDDLQYHKKWSWLMPVVEEIHTEGYEVVISSNGVTTLYSGLGGIIFKEDSEEDDHMHDATYKVVVKFIKERNIRNNKKA